jgi:inorganic pyrophosphatase
MFSNLPVWDEESGHLHVIVDTPGGSCNKYRYEEQYGIFKLKTILPVGLCFPFDFGFIPATHAEDGDPLDVLLLMDAPAFSGCLVTARLLGVLAVEQKEKGKKKVRNDRLIAVAAESVRYQQWQTLRDLPKDLLEEIEQFFLTYTKLRGKKLTILGRYGVKRAQQLIDSGMKKFQQKL